MPNLNQAPKLVYNGNKDQKSKGWGKAIRTHELESAIMCGLGDRDFAMMKIMLFLTGNAPGFLVAEKTICDRCNISETGYKKARKKLIDMGWLSLSAGSITVNFDNIMKGYPENTSISTKDTDKKLGITGDTSKGCTGDTPTGITGDTHNNINNNINNNSTGSSKGTTSSTSAKPSGKPKWTPPAKAKVVKIPRATLEEHPKQYNFIQDSDKYCLDTLNQNGIIYEIED